MHDFETPKDTPFWVSLAKWMLPAAMKVKYPGWRVQIVGDGLSRIKKLAGIRTAICPNHPAYDDSDMIFQFSKLVGENFNYLTAHEIFHARGGVNGLLQYLGCYSIVRGRSDYRAFRVTRDLIVEGKRKVVIFPEGEVSHQNDHLLPLKSGPVLISFAALEEMNNSNRTAPVLILPVSIRYNFTRDETPSLKRRIHRLEGKLDLKHNSNQTLNDRLAKLLPAVVAVLEREYGLLPEVNSSLDDRIAQVRINILARVAAYLKVALPPGEDPLDWAHKLQAAIYERQFHHLEQNPRLFPATRHQRTKELRVFCRDLYRVVNSISIYEGSLKEPVTQEHFADIIGVLEEEVFGSRSDMEPRLVLFDIGEPINLQDFYDEYLLNKIETVHKVNQILALQLTAMVQRFDQQRKPIYITRQNTDLESKWEQRKTVLATISNLSSAMVRKSRPKWNEGTVRRLNDKAMLEMLQAEAISQQHNSDGQPEMAESNE